MHLLSVEQLDVKGKRVLVRVDLNVPMDGQKVTDDSRVTAAVLTIREILDRGGHPILIAHLGRPRGKPDPSKSLCPVANVLSRCLGGIRVIFATDCVGAEAEQAIANMRDGEVVSLENLRFHAGEAENNSEFAAARKSRRRLCQRRLFSSASASRIH